jgi:transcriptional regulator with XRE-family HTH domain
MTSRLQDALSDDVLQEEIGGRIQRRRLDFEWTQAELADLAGVSKRTLERLEAGHSITLTSFLRILRALELLPALDEALPRPGPRPIELLRREGHERRRAPRRKEDEGPWTWGDS